MAVSSIFDMRFRDDVSDEGFELSQAIANDMLATEGCTGSHVVRDLNDWRHLAIVTVWNARNDGEAVLREYPSNPKITRITELLGHKPNGLLGEIADVSNNGHVAAAS